MMMEAEVFMGIICLCVLCILCRTALFSLGTYLLWCRGYIAKMTIVEWQKNPWLQGEEILLLDSENTTTLCGHRLHYDFEMGLVEEKEEKNE